MTFRVAFYEMNRPSGSRQIGRYVGVPEEEAVTTVQENHKALGYRHLAVMSPETSVGQEAA